MRVRVDVQRKGAWKTIHPLRWRFLRGPIEAVNVQGVIFAGEPWYEVVSSDLGSVIVQTPSNTWKFYLLCPDPDFDGRVNTLQEQISRVSVDLRARKQGSSGTVETPRGWREFKDGLSRKERKEVAA